MFLPPGNHTNPGLWSPKWLRRARLTYRITDFYPEVLIAELGRRSWLSAVERVTWFVRRRVDEFEVLGEDQRSLLIAGGIAPERIRLKRDVSPVTIRAGTRPAARPAPLSNRKILLYSGNYSTAHDVDTVVHGFIRHRLGGGGFGLWLNATGGKADIVEQSLRDAGIPIARSAPGPLDELPGLLLAADAHLISLRLQFSGIVLPSKVYGCIASRKPILFVGPVTSDVHLLCRQADLPAYERVEPGDVTGFADALDRLAR
jgi:glycosyltransferase involved in cell wall biosynthesis